MSASAPAVNSVTLVGNLTADPVLKQLNEDRQVCNLRLAVNDQKDQPPMFIDVATFGAQADACAKGNFSRCGVVESLGNEQLACGILDATQFVDLVPLPLPDGANGWV